MNRRLPSSCENLCHIIEEQFWISSLKLVKMLEVFLISLVDVASTKRSADVASGFTFRVVRENCEDLEL